MIFFTPLIKYYGASCQDVAPSQSAIGIDNEQVLMEFSTYMFGMEDEKKSIGGIDVAIPRFDYTLTTERIIATKNGVVGSKGRTDLELVDVEGVEVKQGIADRVTGTGDVIVKHHGGKMAMKRIKDPYDVKDAIRSAAGQRAKLLDARSRTEFKRIM